MPRLGDSSSNNNNDSNTRRNAATAYQQARNRYPLSNFLLLLFCTLILRNMFFHDYRKEEISSLQASGKSPEQIAKLVPDTAAEKRQRHTAAHHHVSLSDLDILKKQVKVLQDEVDLLKANLKQQDDSEQVDSEEMDETNESDHAPPPMEEEEEEEEEEGVEEEVVEEEEEDPEIIEEPKPVVEHAKPKTKTAAAATKLRGSTAKRTAKKVPVVSTKMRAPKKTTTRKRVVKKARADPVVV
jgi:uncharacterized small protein (DUF1192 family)